METNLINNSSELVEINRDFILGLEDRLKQIPGVMIGDCCPLKHTFADGCYIREIFMPKGSLFITKIHKIEHPYFILKGDVSVLTDTGINRIKGPYSGITSPGTKRVIYNHEDTVWITVHVTKETDISKIENEIIAKDFGELDVKQIANFIDTVTVENAVLIKGE
jgi:hypothetical protein